MEAATTFRKDKKKKKEEGVPQILRWRWRTRDGGGRQVELLLHRLPAWEIRAAHCRLLDCFFLWNLQRHLSFFLSCVFFVLLQPGRACTERVSAAAGGETASREWFTSGVRRQDGPSTPPSSSSSSSSPCSWNTCGSVLYWPALHLWERCVWRRKWAFFHRGSWRRLQFSDWLLFAVWAKRPFGHFQLPNWRSSSEA